MYVKLFSPHVSAPKIPPIAIKFIELPLAVDNLGLPPAIYWKFHNDINQAITEFNRAGTSDAKKIALQKMQAAIQYVDLNAPPNSLAAAVKFHTLKQDLFNQVKRAYAENGVHSLLQAGKDDSPVARVVADLPPVKADKLMEILHKGRSVTLQVELQALFDPMDTSPEAIQWREFLRKHTVEFLGGGNSKNFKVTNIDPTDPKYGSVKVLKVDNRLGMPRHVEQHLRGALGDVFTPIDADRQVRGVAPDGKTVSRTLLVTDLCTSGSVDEHSTKVRAKGSAPETYKAASDIMGQMAQVFLDIQKANCCFPDSKLTNWLVDDKGKIRLADTKSFVFTNGGWYSRVVPGNENVGLLRTGGFVPRELDNPSGFDAEKLHSSLLGRNIFAYLTGGWPHDPMLLNEPIFMGPIGQEYKQLIRSLTQDPASARMGLKEAQAKLQDLELRLDPVKRAALIGAGQTSLASTLKAINIDIPSQSPFQMRFRDELSYLSLKKYLDRNSIPYSFPPTGGIQLRDDFFLQKQSISQMVNAFSNPLIRDQIIADVRADKMQEQRMLLAPQANLLRGAVSTIQGIDFNTSGDALQPIKGIQFFFNTQQEAEVFIASIRKYDPSLYSHMAAVGSRGCYVECSPRLLQNPAYNAVVQNYQAIQKDNLIAERKTSLSQTLTSISALGISVPSQSPFQMRFRDELSYLCLKKYLDKNSIPYSFPPTGGIQLGDDFFLQQQSTNQMAYAFSNPVLRDQIIAAVRADKVQEQQIELTSRATLLRREVSAIQGINFNTSGDALQPIKGVQFFFNTPKEAEVFIAAIRKYDPSLYSHMAAAQNRGGYVECSPRLLQNPAFNAVVLNYRAAQRDLLIEQKQAAEKLEPKPASFEPKTVEVPANKAVTMLRNFVDHLKVNGKGDLVNSKGFIQGVRLETPKGSTISKIHITNKEVYENYQQFQAAQKLAPSIVKPQVVNVPTASPKPGLIPFRVDFEKQEGGKQVPISAKNQATKILDEVNRLHKLGAKTVGITYSANQGQTDQILATYQKGQWKTGTKGSNQAEVIKEIEKLLETKYQHLQKVYRIVPITTMKYVGVPPKAVAADDDSVKKSLKNADQFIANGGVLLGWTNQFTKAGKLAIGGGVASKVQTAPQKVMIDHWVKDKLASSPVLAKHIDKEVDLFVPKKGLPKAISIVNKYDYQVSKPSEGRYHFFSASADSSEKIKEKYQGMRGDYLKTIILKEFKSQIEKENIESKEDLKKFKEKLMNTDEYKLLAKGQGLFTRLTGIKTSSQQAFDDMFKQKEESLEKPSFGKGQ